MSANILSQPASNFQSKIDLFLQDCHAKKLVHYPHGEDYTPPDLAKNPEQFAKCYMWDVHLGYITDILREFQQEAGPGFCNYLNEIQKIVDYENSIPNKWEYTLTIGDIIEDIEDSIIDDLTSIDGEPYALEDMERKILDLELAGERINDHRETCSANKLFHRVWLIDTNELKCRQRAIGEKIDKMREESQRREVEARREYYANPNNFFHGKTFIPKRTADFLMWQYELRYAGSHLWIYRDGVYGPEGADLVKKETQRYLREYTTTNRVNESANYIERETLTAMP